MKQRFIDPFTPNRPIDDPERFFGRADPVAELVDALFQIKNSNPKHSIVTGDRGVGKSSLLGQIQLTATGDNRLSDRLLIDRGCDQFDFICVWHDCDSTQSAFDMANAILRKFESSFSKFTKGLTVELDLAGFAKLGANQQSAANLAELIEEFCGRLDRVCTSALKAGKDGVLIFVDEIDRLSVDSMVASFMKLATERLARDRVKNLSFMAAGITGAVQKLEDEHGSILRTFRDVPLTTFKADEVEDILLDGFQKVERKVVMSNLGAKAWEVTVGLPEPIHLLGSEMLSVDEDSELNEDDFSAAIEKIVTDVRRNKLASLLRSAGGGKYQKIVEAIAAYDKKIVPLQEIANHLGHEQNTFATNMATLLDRGILLKPQIGYYTFSDPMLKEYIKINGVLNMEE